MSTARDRPPEEASEDTSFARGLRVLLTVADRGEVRADELSTLLDTRDVVLRDAALGERALRAGEQAVADGSIEARQHDADAKAVAPDVACDALHRQALRRAGGSAS